MKDLNLNPIPIKSDFIIEISQETPPQITAEVEDNIEKIWEIEKKQLGNHLFNGQLLSMVYATDHKLVGRFVQYKHYLAQMRDRSLENTLHIKPVGVSGRTTSAESLLIGRRSQNVFLDRGLYELVPSGGVDPQSMENNQIQIDKQIEIELLEETGINTKFIKKQTPFMLLQDGKLGIYEICIDLLLESEASHIDPPINTEYSEIFWITKKDIPNFLKHYANQIIPVTKWLLQNK